MTNKNNGFHGWLKQNAWPITIAMLGVLSMGVIGLSKIEINVQAIEEIEKSVAEYPSKDWFELKFQNIDEKLSNLEKKVDKK